MDSPPKKREIGWPVKGHNSKRSKQDEEEDNAEDAVDTKCTPQEIVGIEIDKNEIKKYLRNPENQSTSQTGIQRRTHCNRQSHALQSRMCRALERDLL